MKITEEQWELIEQLAVRHFGMEMMPSTIPEDADEVADAIEAFQYQRENEAARAGDCLLRDAKKLMQKWDDDQPDS